MRNETFLQSAVQDFTNWPPRKHDVVARTDPLIACKLDRHWTLQQEPLDLILEDMNSNGK